MVMTAQDAKLRPGYKRTEVGVIPEDWKIEKLGDCLLGAPQYGINAPAVQYTDSLPIYIRITDITADSRFSPENIASVRYVNGDKYVLRAGDLVFARTGASVGKTYLYKPEDGKLVFAGYLIRVKANPAKLLPGYLAAYVKTGRYWSWVRAMSMRSGQPGINGTEYAQLPIPLPSPPEQQAIATALSDVDALITSLDRLIAKKRDIKQAMMQQLLTGKTRLPGFSGDCVVKELGEIREKFVNGGTPSTQKSEYWQGNIPWITGADVINQKISDIRRFITTEAVKNSSTNIVERGNLLLVTRTGVGKLAIASFDVAISQDITGIYVKKEQASIEYLFHYFNYSSETLKSLNQGTSIAGITRETLLSTRVYLPSLLEQQAIATVLSDMDAEIAALEQKRDKTHALKQGMMQELLTGKTRLI